MKKVNDKVQVKQKKPIRQKIIVEQGRTIGTPIIPYRMLYTEIVDCEETAKARVKELQDEYKEVDAISIHYFGL